jgi:pimeloyl-ACP methyl ester carboxylesterase
MNKAISIEGLSLAYEEVNPERKQTLFFIHHNSGSSRLWKNQLASSDLQKYRMIVIDLPGHGESSASEIPEFHYGLLDLGRVMGKVAKELCDLDSCIMVGFSVGTNIILEALNNIKPKGIALVGPSIVGNQVSYAQVIKPGVNSSPLFLDTAPQTTIEELFSLFLYSKNSIVLNELLEDYQRVKPPFRSSFYKQTVEKGRLSDELTLLNQSRVPALLVFGKEDELNNPNYLDHVELSKWNNEIYKLPSAGHFVHLDQPELFNRLLSEYIDTMFKECHA